MTVTLDQIGSATPAVLPRQKDADTTDGEPVKVSVKPSDKRIIRRPFRSGFCGVGPRCADIGSNCVGVFKNGSAAPNPTTTCTCVCHNRPETTVST